MAESSATLFRMNVIAIVLGFRLALASLIVGLNLRGAFLIQYYSWWLKTVQPSYGSSVRHRPTLVLPAGLANMSRVT